jgi:two-component system, OmpR family, sensor kinase
MFDSVRVRLTLWYSTLMACALVGIALVTYFGIRQNAMRRTDASLADLAESFLTTLMDELHDQDQPSLENSAQAAIAEHSFRDVAFFVVDENQHIAVSSHSEDADFSSAAGVKEFHRKVTRDEAEGSKRPFHTILLEGKPHRGYARAFKVRNEKYTLVVLQSLHQQQEFLSEVGVSFALIIPLVIALTSVGGYFLARKSLAPVVAMSAQAGRIGEANLHNRLAIKNSKDELGLLAASFNGLLDRLDQSFERQRRFIADASHELRTPVAVLCGEAEVALSQKDRSASEFRESVGILEREATRLKLIVEDLFTLARADAGQYPLTLTHFYLDELSVDCCRTVRTLAMAKGVVLHCDAVKETPVYADEGLLRRMILNLLDNAIKHTPQGGSVSVACGMLDGASSLAVSDTGSGIPVELQPRIFERFFRADKARARAEDNGGGAGLGLSISRWIAEAHHGRLELTRSDGAGSVFAFTMPNTDAVVSQASIEEPTLSRPR